MAQGTVVFVGGPLVESAALHRLVPEFGWSLETAADIARLRELGEATDGPSALDGAHTLPHPGATLLADAPG